MLPGSLAGMVVWMRVKRSRTEVPCQLATKLAPAKGGAISPPFSSAPWQMAHFVSNSALPWVAWSAVNTPLHTVRAGACAFSVSIEAPNTRLAAVMPNSSFVIFGLHQSDHELRGQPRSAPRQFPALWRHQVHFSWAGAGAKL